MLGSLATLKSELSPHQAEISISVRELDSGQEILEVSGRQMRTPASVAKLVSSACALRTLGTDFSFATTFGIKGTITQGILNGDLVVRGSGDPSLVIEDLAQIARILHSGLGLKEIKGKLLLDLSYFPKDVLSFANEDFAGDEGRSFTSDLTALPFNHNSFAVWVSAHKPGAHVAIIPADAVDVRVLNNVKVIQGASQSVRVDFQPKAKIVAATGTIGEAAEPKVIYRSVSHPFDYFARTFALLWREAGGRWANPQYQISLKPISMVTLHTHRSRSVSRLLLDINKLSTNFGAELVGLAAAASMSGTPTNFDKQSQWLRSCLKDFQISETQMQLANASGLSRDTKMSSSALSDFLVKQRRQDYFPEYLSSLSILGRDGTTRSRFKSSRGKARLKTGSIKNVRSVAGYVDSQTRGALAFSLLINSTKMSDEDKRALEDRTLERLLEL